MVIDLNTLEDGVHLKTDFCVIGAGTAGITIAREFFGSSTAVLLLEGAATIRRTK